MQHLFRIVCVFCIFLLPDKGNVSFSQIVNKYPLSARLTEYSINATLDTETKTIHGRMEAFWVNNSFDYVPDVQMHLYLNAFRNERSTFNRESGGYNSEGEGYGWIDIKSLTNSRGIDLMPSMQFISPDDGNPDDMTAIKINLPRSTGPGDTVFLNIDFESRLPSNIRRTGFNDDFYFVAQWFPKFGVYERAGMRYARIGGWNCHQYHAHSEFYSNHSVYNVNITVPKEYVVGTGGVLLNETENGEGKKTLYYRAEDIVDFAWTAWPGYDVHTDQWKHVEITLLLPKERIDQVERQFRAVRNALEYMTERIGPYPWPHLTFADPPAKGAGAGGMEYTTLFTTMSSYKMPSSIHLPELVTIHEFGHAYFMGIIASNEAEEPWLDEGVNTFWEERIVDHYYGRNSGLIDLPFLKVPDKSVSRISYVTSPNRQVVSNNEFSWNYPHNTYGMMSYNKASTWLFTLMGIIGEETINEIFREYYKRWAFKHPSGKDFINIVNEVTIREHGNRFGPDMNWFFDQTLYGTGLCDYRVSGIINKRPVGTSFSTDSGDSTVLRIDSVFNSVVQLERIGEVKMPVEILVHFENGEELLEFWDGITRHKDIIYYNSPKVLWVKIDPEYKITMDVNYINNSMTLEPDRIPVRRMIDKLITFLQFFMNIISL